MQQKKRKIDWKVDEITLVLVVAFIALAAGIYSKISNPPVIEAEKITGMLMDRHSVSFATNGVIDQDKLNEIQKMDYNEFKRSLDVKNDFCVYVQDGDGNIIISKGSLALSKDGLCVV